MYQTRFGLRQRPFPATPDSSCYYPATGHERALGLLCQAVEEQQGIALVTGEPGIGKTLVAHCALERLGPDAISAFLPNGRFADRTALLQAVMYDLSLPYEGATEQQLRLRLTDFLLQNRQAGRKALLLVDEAQHLTPDLLEELRLMGNLEAGSSKALHVILAGQAKLLQTLRLPELNALQQRLEVRASLEPLGVEEAADYVLHHLRRAGGKAESIISDEALELLARHTRGVPRMLNQASRQALVLADAADASHVDAEAVLEALSGLGIEVADESAVSVGSTLGAVGFLEKDGENAEGVCHLFEAPPRIL